MKPQTLIMLVVALGCGLAAMVMTQRFLSADETDGNKPSVIVAATDIRAGVLLNDTMVRAVEWENELLPEGAITDIEAVIGRAVKHPIGVNEVVTEMKIAAEGVGAGLEPVIEDGMRAISAAIETHESAAGFVKPGSRVDILLVKRRSGSREAEVKCILQDTKVIAVNQHISGEPGDDRGTVVEMVTFLVKPEDAEALTLAQGVGEIRLALRSPTDDVMVKSKGTSERDLGSRGNLQETAQRQPRAILTEAQTQAVGQFFTGVMKGLAEQAAKRAEEPVVVVAEPEPLPEPEPIEPPKEYKLLVYRDLDGNRVGQVLLEAEDPRCMALKDFLEDAPPEMFAAEAFGAKRGTTPVAGLLGPQDVPNRLDEEGLAEEPLDVQELQQKLEKFKQALPLSF